MPSSGCKKCALRSEGHTSELQSHDNLVCHLLLEKKINTTGRSWHLSGSGVCGPGHGRGRPVGFRAQHAVKVLDLPHVHLTDAQMADFFFTETAPREFPPLSLPDPLPI